MDKLLLIANHFIFYSIVSCRYIKASENPRLGKDKTERDSRELTFLLEMHALLLSFRRRMPLLWTFSASRRVCQLSKTNTQAGTQMQCRELLLKVRTRDVMRVVAIGR